MACPESQFTATAGEHFVAYRIAACGFVPSLVRQSVKSFDLMASTSDSSRSVGLMIKTTVQARREAPGGRDILEFPFSPRSVERMASSALFCFVDLQGKLGGLVPDVFVVPMIILKAEYAGVRAPKYLQHRYCRPPAVMERFRNNWEPLYAALGGRAQLARADVRVETETDRESRPAPTHRSGEHTLRIEIPSTPSIPLTLVTAASMA